MQSNNHSEAADPIDAFIEQVRWLQEPEFGDFKRKVGLYLNRLQEDLIGPGGQLGRAVDQTLNKMRMAALYVPNGDMESTRRQLLQLAEQLKAAR